MSRLPTVSARDMLSALRRAGFVIVRIKGSHHFLRHKDDPSRETVVALHTGDLPAGTVRAILRQAKLSRAEFVGLL
ncbi:MAG: type II toxin-antitoxin system HicA family toxin [Methyloceanibacter sp.]|nr:type II toxin-antitoxin system HicA family toxin [Methyloceanibacter sp.]